MNKKLIFLVLGILFCLSFASAVCTLNFDSGQNYSQGETITAQMSCSEVNEKNTAYNVNWTNASGFLLEQDAGTTPTVADTNFFETYTIPLDYVATNGSNITATLSGENLEGTDLANITSASSNSLIIEDVNITAQILLTRTSAIHFNVKDENDKLISNAMCALEIFDGDSNPVIAEAPKQTIDGELGFFTSSLSAESFTEGNQYEFEIHCSCGIENTSLGCWDEDGLPISNSVGSSAYPFTIDTWLEVNTLVDKTEYELKEEVFVCANVTNVNYTKRIPMHIYHQIRCSNGLDNESDLDRILIAHDDEEPDERGISTGTTQMQCKKFTIPELKYLQGQNSSCYASTTVWVLNDMRQKVVSYATTSDNFNITSNELNLEPDWQWIGNNRLNAIVNLSSSAFNDYNGTSVGNVDLRVFSDSELNLLTPIDIFNVIETITVRDTAGLLTEHTNYELEFLEDGHVEIELRDVNLSKYDGRTWWNVTIDFYDHLLNNTKMLERQAAATEGIENKTGTFHLDVICDEGEIGGLVQCYITSYIEEEQIVQKEVKFTCYISENNEEISSQSFNQMITRTPQTFTRSFLVPSYFLDGNQYTLQCHADYYNFGSRRDSFFTTFIAKEIIGDEEVGGVGIIQSIIDKADEVLDDIEEIIEGISPDISDVAKKNIALLIIFICSIVAFVFIFGLIIFFYTKIHEKYLVD